MAQVNYPAILTEAWEQHLVPREENAPIVVSTFAGGGGSSLGYSMAGYRELLAVEWDDNAVATFKLNFPGVPVYHGDIANLSTEECMKLAGVEPGELDVLDGSPPCQGFSMVGKRKMNDPRNSLFREYVRLLRALRPRVFIMENVSGLIKGKMKLIFAEIMRELKASGYRVSCRLMNAMYFHVPQSRQRLIFVGVRDDLGIEPSHPGAESEPMTVREALENTPDYLAAPPLSGKEAMIAKAIRPFGNGSDVTGGSWWGHQKLAWHKPSRTITKNARVFYHPDTSAHLSVGELRRIHSYPDDFDFSGQWREASARIGNSVPPLFMRAIARHIRSEILDKT